MSWHGTLACWPERQVSSTKGMRLCHSTWDPNINSSRQAMFMQCSQRIREGTTTWRVWTCWPEADATWASVCNWTAVTPPCCWEQEQEELEMYQKGNAQLKTWDHLREGGSVSEKLHPTREFQSLDSSSCPQSGPYNTLLWLTIPIYNAVLLPRNRNSTPLQNIYVKDFYIFLGSQEQNQQVLKAWNYDKEFQGLLKLLKHHQEELVTVIQSLVLISYSSTFPNEDLFPPNWLTTLQAMFSESHQKPLCSWGRPHQDPLPKEAAGSCQCLSRVRTRRRLARLGSYHAQLTPRLQCGGAPPQPVGWNPPPILPLFWGKNTPRTTVLARHQIKTVSFFPKLRNGGKKRRFAIIKPDKSMANALRALIQTSGRLYCGKRQQQELLFNMYSSTEYHPKYYSNIKLQLSRINSGRTGQQTAWNLTTGVSIVIHPCFTTSQHKQGEQ